MDVDHSLQEFGLVPTDDALPRVRELLASEAEAERSHRARVDDLALLCCVQLFSRGYLEDVLRIWDAKQSGFDLSCSLDVQLLCGAGLAETKGFLASQEDLRAASALNYITECESAGDFEGFSPASRLAIYRTYFGVTADAKG
jgi:hypothetical protein